MGILVRAILLALWIFSISEAANEKVLLKDVTALTLYKGQMTTGRRSSPVPQIRCVGGAARGKFEPKIVQCTNQGFDGSDVQWKCTAEMPSDLEFGKITVSCEGYNYAEDPYILKGSCGLEYDLEYRSGAGKSGSGGSWVDTKSKDGGWLNFIATVVVILFVAYILYITCVGDPSRGGDIGGNRGPYGGGWPGSGPDTGPSPPRGPPPSYDDTFGAKTSYPDSTMGFGAGFRNQRENAGQGQGLGGFWTGAGLGALGGYFAGRATAGETRQRNTRFDDDTGFSSSHADRPSTSGMRESTGYGSTSRR
ncbi:hypothetical protein WR25_17024 isoform A [Diploscapter pachys]|uniref:Store-operated calcium entry-associated regulatory factor n=1 Tax=Diploscapter pachys TaxID=2018661 RepID=A0A2A2KEK7_9BILA|nr:hypothetical protein WR25_17024 isoform A [Diploscapter pachys]